MIWLIVLVLAALFLLKVLFSDSAKESYDYKKYF